MTNLTDVTDTGVHASQVSLTTQMQAFLVLLALHMISFTPASLRISLKVPKREIFDSVFFA